MVGTRTIRLSGERSIVEPAALNLRQGGKPNKITTTRFTCLSWIPLSFYWQFHNVANCYFVAVCITIIMLKDRPYPWQPTCFTFAAMLIYTAIKDALEDYGRKKDDDDTNGEECWRFNPQVKKFSKSVFSDVQVGDVIFVRSKCQSPADLMILYSPQGTPVFLSSANLDGETNWKTRNTAQGLAEALRTSTIEKSPIEPEWAQAKKENERVDRASMLSWQFTRQLSVTKSAEDVPEPEAVDIAKTLFRFGKSTSMCSVSKPCTSLWDFSGQFSLGDGPSTDGSDMHFKMTSEALLPRGCILQGSSWVLGVAAYVGQDTKSRLNSSPPRTKTADVKERFNSCLAGVIGAIITIVFLFWGITCLEKFLWEPLFQWFIVLYWIVPIGVYVCMDTLMMLLSVYISRDKMIGFPHDPAKVRTSQIVSDLGQVTHVFSDKTGTLTENTMRFAKATIPCGISLGDFRSKDGIKSPEGVLASRRLMWPSEGAVKGSIESQLSQQLFFCMAICNSLQVKVRKGIPSYSGASPEECAMALAASEVDLTLVSRRPNKHGADTIRIMVGGSDNVQSYRVVHVIDFTSDRKRMSIVLQNQADSTECWCMTKGADNIIMPLLGESMDEESKNYLREFASEGLRTLVFAFKKLSVEFLTKWEEGINAVKEAANLSSDDRSARLAELAKGIECDLTLAGVVAIEDPLSQGVPTAVRLVREAGAKFCMLTGDKTETAISIGRSSRVIGNSSLLLATCEELESLTKTSIHGSTPLDMMEAMTIWIGRAVRQAQGSVKYALVMDSTFFGLVLESPVARQNLYELLELCEACICTRLTPNQKKLLVDVVRKHNPDAITLAIGDGGNDVPMLTCAHIGVGIRGKEGMQAVQASDIAVSEFEHLVPLMLCHGRQNCRRVADSMSWYIYRHVCLAVGTLHYALYSGFAPTQVYPATLLVTYPMAMTIPNVLFFVLDKDMPDETALTRPEEYKKFGPRRKHFNIPTFCSWILLGLFQGSLSWMLPFYGIVTDLKSGETDPMKTSEHFRMASLVAVFANMLVVFAQTMTMSNKYTFMSALVSNGIGLILAILSAYVPDSRIKPDMVNDVLFTSQYLVWICLPCFLAIVAKVVNLIFRSYLAENQKEGLPLGPLSNGLMPLPLLMSDAIELSRSKTQ